MTVPVLLRADLAMGYNLLLFRSKAQRRAGLDLIIRGFRRDPSPLLMQTLLQVASHSPEFEQRIDQVCMEYAAEFEENKGKYADQDGYTLRLEAARLAVVRLKELAQARADTEQIETLAERETRYLSDRNAILAKKQW